MRWADKSTKHMWVVNGTNMDVSINSGISSFCNIYAAFASLDEVLPMSDVRVCHTWSSSMWSVWTISPLNVSDVTGIDRHSSPFSRPRYTEQNTPSLRNYDLLILGDPGPTWSTLIPWVAVLFYINREWSLKWWMSKEKSRWTSNNGIQSDLVNPGFFNPYTSSSEHSFR